MGYWGTQLFEDDCARDVLCEILAPWLESVETLAGEEATAHWDDVFADEIAIKMSILMLLRENGYPIEAMPNSSILKSNRPVFERNWKECAAGEEGTEFQLQRLDTMLDIWDRSAFHRHVAGACAAQLHYLVPPVDSRAFSALWPRAACICGARALASVGL